MVNRTRSWGMLCFFLQAEDGIRDYKVTGVQTCALPIARRRTIALQKERIPRMREKDLAGPKLQKRLNKITNQLIAAINGRLPMVLKDPNSVRDLHLLRIDCRRLRYLAELFRSKKTARLLSRLRSWQSH